MKYFIDTSAWFALYHSRDQYHQPALKASEEIFTQPTTYFTSNFILSEFHTLNMSRLGPHLAVEKGENLKRHTELVIIHITPAQFDKAWAKFKQYADHKLSFVDCANLVIIEEYNLDAIFTFDQTFNKLGIKTIPKSLSS